MKKGRCWEESVPSLAGAGGKELSLILGCQGSTVEPLMAVLKVGQGKVATTEPVSDLRCLKCVPMSFARIAESGHRVQGRCAATSTPTSRRDAMDMFGFINVYK